MLSPRVKWQKHPSIYTSVFSFFLPVSLWKWCILLIKTHNKSSESVIFIELRICNICSVCAPDMMNYKKWVHLKRLMLGVLQILNELWKNNSSNHVLLFSMNVLINWPIDACIYLCTYFWRNWYCISYSATFSWKECHNYICQLILNKWRSCKTLSVVVTCSVVLLTRVISQTGEITVGMFLFFVSGWFWGRVSRFNRALSQVSGVLWCCLSRLAHSGTFHLTESGWTLLLCWLPSDSDCPLYWGWVQRWTLWIRCSVSRVEGCSHVHCVCKPMESFWNAQCAF